MSIRSTTPRLAGAALALCVLLSAPFAAAAPRALAKAPKLEGRALDGTTWKLSAQTGHWTVIAFQAKWCVPCRKEVKELLSLRASDPEVRVVTIGFASTKNETAAFARDLGVTWPAIPDPEGRIGERWGVAGLPATVIVDPSGNVASRFLGGLTSKKIHQLITPAKAAS